MQVAFGSGTLVAQRTDVANATPVKFGVLQSASIEFNGSVKELFGQYQFPVAVARGTVKISCKAQYAQINARAFNDLFFMSSNVAGQFTTTIDELGTITAGAVTVSGSANFTDDNGVINSVTGLPFIRVASAPAVGQYSVAAGVYTFNVGDNGIVVKISYTRSPAGTLPQQKVTVGNVLLGLQPEFQAWFNIVYNTKQMTMKLLKCISTKLSFASKLEDFMVPEFDFSAFADASNNILTYGTDE